MLQRRTSKEIARILDISKPAVDQRLTTARGVLDVMDREEAARLYARLLSTYDRVAYDALHIPSPSPIADSLRQESRPEPVLELREAPTQFAAFSEFHPQNKSPLSRMFGPDLGTGARLIWIVGMAVGILTLVLVGLAVANTLSVLV